MNVLPRIQSSGGSRPLRAPLIALMFLLPAFLPAQTVPYTGNGNMTVIIAVPPAYNGQYVLQQSDSGFFWLDTGPNGNGPFVAGHAQAISNCVPGQPPSDSNLYVIGDCSGITNFSTSGNLVVVRVTSGQCIAMTTGCGGPRDDGHRLFKFGLGGGFPYLGDGTNIPDSTQTADPQGRTWTLRGANDLTQRDFVWTGSSGGGGVDTPTPTPTPTPGTPTPTPTPGTPTPTPTPGGPLTVSLDGPTTGSINTSLTFTANGFGGTQPYFYSWACNYNAIFPVLTQGSQSRPCSYSTPGVYDVRVHLTDSSGAGTFADADASVTIGGNPTATPVPTPTPTPTTGGGLVSVFVSGPSTGARSVPLTFTASASGGTGAYTYGWSCDYSPVFPSFGPGATTRTCTYSAAGTYNVKVQVVDTNTGATNVSPDYFVTIAGLASPLPTYSVTGATPNIIGTRYTSPTGTPVTFTATETRASGYSWDFGDGSPVATTQSATHAFSASGAYAVHLTVTGDGVSTSGTASATVNLDISGPPAPSATFGVTGATQTGSNSYEADAGSAITFTATGANISSYAWDFGDGTSAATNPATKKYATTGSRTVRLTVTGDGTNTSGSQSASIAVNVIPAKFKAMIVPGAAHLDLGESVWGTDVTVNNPGSDTLTITPNFFPYLDGTPDNLDLSQIPYDSSLSFQLAPGASWSQVDVVKYLSGGSNKGTLIFKYEGTADPVVAARVYFASASNPQGPSYGAAFPSYKITGSGGLSTQETDEGLAADQTIIGLRSNDSYRFVVTLYNASNTKATFRLNAFDEGGAPVQIKDGSGSPVSNRDFTIGPYQQIQVSDSGLVFHPGKYVFKASRVGSAGTLIVFGTALDKKTSDLVQITDDTPSTSADGAGNISYYVAGVAHLDTQRAQWRTDLRIYNRSSLARNLSFEYLFTKSGGTEQRARVIDGKRIGPGELLTFDDVVDSLFKPGDPTVDLSGDTAGVLRIFYPEDSESGPKPLIIGLRNYDDPSDGTGTAGTALSVYSAGQSTIPASPALVMPGAEDSSRFYSLIGIFALDDVLTTGRITAYDKAGNEVGHFGFALNQTGPGGVGHFGQVRLSDLTDFANPGTPVTVRVTVTGGGRVGAYAVTVDLKTNDLTFLQGLPQS